MTTQTATQWLIGTLDDGVIGHATSKRGAVEALRRQHNVLGVERIESGDYAVRVGYDADDFVQVFYVMRADVAHGHGFLADCDCEREVHV